MSISDIIGKTITNIYSWTEERKPSGSVDLDVANTVIELDGAIVIDFPSGDGAEICRPETWNVKESIFEVKGKEDFVRNIRNRKIVDYIWFPEIPHEKGWFVLDSGYLITETMVAPHGTGTVGLNYCESMAEFDKDEDDVNFVRFSDKTI